MRNAALSTLLFACVTILALHAMQPADADTQLEQAKQALTGDHKDTDKARTLLLNIVQNGKAEVRPVTLAWSYIYLGYIEDRAKNREAALGWYQKVVALNSLDNSSVPIANYGLKQPLDWLRHLDAPQQQQQPQSAPKQQYGKAYTTQQPPAGVTLKHNLSAADRREHFEDLWRLIDTNYAHFKLKAIDWTEVGHRYRAQLDALTGDDDFYLLMFHLVNELKDTHSWLQGYKPPMLSTVPGMSIDMFNGRPYVLSGAKAGWEVLSVDGFTVADKLESLRPYIPARSSERAFQRQAGRLLLAGDRDSAITVKLRSPEDKIETVQARRGAMASPPPAQKAAFDLTRQRFVHFGKHPSGLGYIRIESFNGREEIADEFDRALEALRDSPGLILDIRENPGGYNQSRIVGRLLQKRSLAIISYSRNGPKHDDLARRESYLEPTGKWQYTGPVALLVNVGTGSAADLFACQLRSAGRVVTIGTTTEGNLSGVAIYAVLPCGLVVRISNGFISDAAEHPIEVNGNIPDIVVEPDIQDYLHGRDPVLQRAADTILARVRAASP